MTRKEPPPVAPPPVRPSSIRLEASSFCQLRCPSCPTAAGDIDAVVGRGNLDPEHFGRLLADNPTLQTVELSNYGEVFLNPHLLSIFEIAKARGVALTILNGANLNTVRDEVLEGLVKYKVRDLTCSIDGASDETYKIYRVRGHFDTVIENIKKINAYKKQYNSKFPRLRWQFVVFGHNEHEISVAREMAKSLDMAFYTKISWDSAFSPIRDRALVERETGEKAVTRDEFAKKKKDVYLEDICDQLWVLPQINFDGKVLGCCVNYWGDFGGNAFKDGLVASLNSEKMTYARDMLEGKAPPRADIPCVNCNIYKSRQELGIVANPDAPKKRAKRLVKSVMRWFDDRMAAS